MSRKNSRNSYSGRRRKGSSPHLLPIAIVAACLLVIGIGIYGACSISRRENPSPDSPHRSQPESVAANKQVYGDLTEVITPAGVPSAVKDYEGFRVSFNKDNRTPNWVAWELLGSETEGSVPRSNNFWADPDLEDCSTPDDYRRSGYDRGHLCPAADQKWSEQAMADCFVMSNMAPQDHALNAGAWNTLENKERVWAARDSALVIVAGPLYDKSDRQRIGEGGVRVPGAFFKVLLAPYLPEPRAIGFIFPNMTAPGNMMQYSMTVREVEKATGLDFFSALPDSLEKAVETKAFFDDWNRSARKKKTSADHDR